MLVFVVLDKTSEVESRLSIRVFSTKIAVLYVTNIDGQNRS